MTAMGWSLLLLSVITQCQLRGSSESISAVAEQFCSSTKTRMRTFIASLKVCGFWLVVVVDVGRARGVFGPGGGCIEVVKVGLEAILGGHAGWQW